EVPMTRTKLLTAAAVLVGVLAAGTATTLIPLASAQRPNAAEGSGQNARPPGETAGAEPQKPPMGRGGGMSMGSRSAAAGAWEYKFVPRKGDSLEAFEKILRDHAVAGWEYCGTEALTVTDPARRGEWGTSPTIVCKRPRAAHGSTSGMSTGGMMGMGPPGMAT